MKKLLKLLLMSPLLILLYCSSPAKASGTVPVGPSYSMTFEGQWNPPYAAGNEPDMHVGAWINDITPTPIPGPVSNTTNVTVGTPIVGTPTVNDIPLTFQDFGPNLAAERIGTTIGVAILPFIPLPYNTPLWTRNDIVDADGHTLVMYTFYPDGFTGTDDQTITAYVYVNNQWHMLTIPPPDTSGQPGPIVSFTDNNVRMQEPAPSQVIDTPAILPDVGSGFRIAFALVGALAFLATPMIYSRRKR